MTGDSVRHYRVLEKIGEGGMGAVYKALDTRLDRLVALKTLPSLDPTRKRQFLWEARAAAGLRHPNIVIVYDLISLDDTECIVMEYIPGRPLSDILADGPLPLSDALSFAREIASALETAHTAGIVHRDLKPANILITPEKSVKLVDFGVAILQNAPAPTPHVAGTLGYISPEQARGERATAQSDIFSFGGVLYEMITGARAVNGNTAACVLNAVTEGIPSASSLVPDLPPPLDKLIQQCLRGDPRRRLRHMGDIRLALEDIDWMPQLPPRRIGLRWWRRLAYGAMLAVLPAGWLVLANHTQPEMPSMPIPLTSFEGQEMESAWSPDGRQVAFVWDSAETARAVEPSNSAETARAVEPSNGGGTNQDIYLMQPGSSQVLRLTTDPASDLDPAWSPTGQEIAYVHISDDRSRYSLNLVSPLGGAPRTLLSSATSIGSPAWSPDGQIIVYETRPQPRSANQLWAVMLATGAARQLTDPPSGIPGDLRPALSPDGATLAFCRKTGWRTAELYLLDLASGLRPSGTPRRVTDLGYVNWPAWTPDGSRILFEAHREGVGIWQIDRSGKRPRPVFGVPDSASEPAIAARPDGHWSLAFTENDFERTIWRYPTANGPAGPPVELVPSSREQSYPAYSPDGKRLAFTSTRSGYEEVWVANVDGSLPVQLTDLRHQLTEVGHWTPEGDAIAFVSQNRGGRQIYFVAASGGPARPLTNEPGVEGGTGWSHDGAAYYYTSNRAGRQEVWKVFRRDGKTEQVTHNGGWSGFESGQGIFYYCRRVPGRPVSVVRTAAEGERELPLQPPALGRGRVVPAPHGFYYKALGTDEIYSFDENTGRTARVLSRLHDDFNWFTISPGGRWFATDFVGKTKVDLMLMEHFR